MIIHSAPASGGRPACVVVVVLSLLWVLCTAGLAVWMFALTFAGIALERGPRLEERDAQLALVGYGLAALSVGAPLVIAAVAARARLDKTAGAFVAVAVLIGGPAAYYTGSIAASVT